MKYSFLLPYYKRYDQFKATLISFCYHYGNRNDFEIIVGEDEKNGTDAGEHDKLCDLINSFNNKLNIRLIKTYFSGVLNPCLSFNKCALNATGEFFIISNPECFHSIDILSELDKEIEHNNNQYIVCACEAAGLYTLNTFEDFKYETDNRLKHCNGWLQHSIYRNRMLHFCSCLSRANFIAIDGFDPNYQYGVAYEDDDFLHKIISTNIPIKCRDDLKVIHLEHERSFQLDEKLIRINREYFFKKWPKTA